MARRDWSHWTISLAPPRLIPDHPDGLTEPRSFVKCPVCLEQINVASATAMKNRSLTGRNHLKKCPGQSTVCELVTAPTNTTTEDEVDVVLPPSKRPRGSVMSEMNDRLAAMQQQMSDMQHQQHRDKMEIMYTIARVACLGPPRPETHEALVEGLKIKMLKYDNMEKQLTCTICYENPVQALVRPCNHVSMCLVCFNRYKTARCSRTTDDHSALRCPICRTAADDVWPVSIGAAV